MINELRYKAIRSQIENGDVIFFRASTFMQKLITFITRGSYSHCGIAFWMTDNINKRLLLIEATNGGRRIITLSHYANREFKVLRLGLVYDKACSDMLGLTGLPYSYVDFLKIGCRSLLRKFGIKIKFEDSPGEVCSEFVAHTLASQDLFKEDTLIDPSSLYDAVENSSTFNAYYSLS